MCLTVPYMEYLVFGHTLEKLKYILSAENFIFVVKVDRSDVRSVL